MMDGNSLITCYLLQYMTNEEIKIKLDAVLNRLGMDAKAWSEFVSRFQTKLELLAARGNYKELLKSLFSSNDLSEFNSYVFEVLFAYDFESNNKTLIYEVNQAPSECSSIDFFYHNDNIKIYFELRLIQQRNWITTQIKSQLAVNNFCETLLNGNDETDEAIRIQNLILSKCQTSDGKPTKFYTVKDGTLNFIVLNISELHLGMIDKADCFLPMYGDKNIHFLYRRGIFGMWQSSPLYNSEIEQKLYEKFRHFRETIHGVLFVRYVKGSGYFNNMFIDRELEYFAILNNNILSKKTSDRIGLELASFLPHWPDKIITDN